MNTNLIGKPDMRQHNSERGIQPTLIVTPIDGITIYLTSTQVVRQDHTPLICLIGGYTLHHLPSIAYGRIPKKLPKLCSLSHNAKQREFFSVLPLNKNCPLEPGMEFHSVLRAPKIFAPERASLTTNKPPS